MDQEKRELMEEEIRERMRESCIDPELGINIVDLGLVYDIDISDEGDVTVTMTLTAMGCPLAGIINQMVSSTVSEVEGVKDVHVNIVWDPPWSKERMSRAARMQLGIH